MTLSPTGRLAVLFLLASVGCGPNPYRDDADEDGYPVATDCADDNPDIHPEAPEVCDGGVDQDCNGLADADDPALTDAQVLHPDADGDTWGDATSTTIGCPGATMLVDGTDCDDANPDVHPGAPEVCDVDRRDEDCDGLANGSDPGATGSLPFYADQDRDGFGGTDLQESCDRPDGYTDTPGDCDDFDPDTFPGAPESCDGTDEDCDGETDEGVTTTVYADADGDAFGDPATAHLGCDGVTDATDCDDSNPGTYPAAPEVCDDGLDQDCDPGAGTCDLAGARSGTDADVQVIGAAGMSLGAAIAGGRDVDGDGRDDWVVGAPSADGSAFASGMAWVFLGGGRGTFTAVDADIAVTGQNTGENVGIAVLLVDDADGDGLADLVVGASGARGSGAPGGVVAVFGGTATGTLTTDDASSRFYSTVGMDAFGTVLAPIGDERGNDVRSIAIGAPGSDRGEEGAGSVWIAAVSAPGAVDADTLAWRSDGTGDAPIGAALAGPGDVDGDGVPDIGIGSPAAGRDRGEVYLFLAPESGTFATADADIVLSGEDDFDEAGAAIGRAGDQDGDGRGDLLVGAPSADGAGTESGTVYIVSSPASGDLANAYAVITGEGEWQRFGSAMAGVGDINADGREDLAAWADAWPADVELGRLYLLAGGVSGVRSAADAFLLVDGPRPSEGTAARVVGAGDTDGNGHLDVLLGLPRASGSGLGAGTAWLLEDHDE